VLKYQSLLSCCDPCFQIWYLVPHFPRRSNTETNPFEVCKVWNEDSASSLESIHILYDFSLDESAAGPSGMVSRSSILNPGKDRNPRADSEENLPSLTGVNDRESEQEAAGPSGMVCTNFVPTEAQDETEENLPSLPGEEENLPSLPGEEENLPSLPGEEENLPSLPGEEESVGQTDPTCSCLHGQYFIPSFRNQEKVFIKNHLLYATFTIIKVFFKIISDTDN
jgi:hypothetical protein